MIASMTGFGKGSALLKNVRAEAEVKSLNSRFLDVSLKLPKNLYQKEFDIRDIIKEKVVRGKVTIFVLIKKDGVDNRFGFLDEGGLDSAVQLLNKIKERGNIKEQISIEDLLQLKDLFMTDSAIDPESEFKLAAEAIKEALKNLNEMRRKEGKELAVDLETRVNSINDSVDKIEDLNKTSIEEYFSKIKNRASQLLEEFIDNPDRMNTELALLAEKYDVTEECVRLRSHNKMFLQSLKNSGEVGRKLNFISQEMNREVNTINSKTISTEISQIGISVKEELEKIREQLQNIE